MNSSPNPTPNQVLTYDGHRNAQRPRMIVFESQEYLIIECETLYISTGEATDAPVKRGFHVRCKGGRQFKLELIEGTGWIIDALPGPFST
ncbi:MAG: hypothetical protein JXX29_08710 [Deltaproteobacteria bacterium]|nr:hypothetical protein [Deltaproteobacteria bacterium]MBN2671741.1 hypothetical protein [Deltaproteobacteria bacterium]